MSTAASRHLAGLLKEEKALVARLNRLKESTEWGMGKQWQQAFARMVKRGASGGSVLLCVKGVTQSAIDVCEGGE